MELAMMSGVVSPVAVRLSRRAARSALPTPLLLLRRPLLAGVALFAVPALAAVRALGGTGAP